jgi:hypothetical protein
MIVASTTRQDWLPRAFCRRKVLVTHIFSPVVKMTTIRIVLRTVAAENLYLEQLNVKTTFLHGELEEDIYMR